jgi:hypothetical protein
MYIHYMYTSIEELDRRRVCVEGLPKIYIFIYIIFTCMYIHYIYTCMYIHYMYTSIEEFESWRGLVDGLQYQVDISIYT